MNTEHTNQSRSQFEAWASEHCCATGGISFKRFSDDGASWIYNDPNVETAWQAWQAASQQQGEPAEHGLYVILYRDNWDGEGDTSYLLARLDPNGEWYAEESGAQLMTYEGDAILRAWPITEDTAMQPDPKPVLNCWCCSTLVTFKQCANADGNCPHCGAELDVDKDLAAQQQADPVAPAVKESLTAEPQAELTTLCASCARANVDCPIYPQQADSCVEHSPATQQQAEPVAWVRFCSDGCYEGPIMNSDSRMDGVRRTSGAWTPLYAAQPPAVAARIRELEAQLNAATTARQEAQQVAQEAIEARNRAGVEIRRPLLKRIAELEAQQAVAPDDVAKDAARYRWMRQDESEFSSMAPAELDAAIDKAIAAAQKGGAA